MTSCQNLRYIGPIFLPYTRHKKSPAALPLSPKIQVFFPKHPYDCNAPDDNRWPVKSSGRGRRVGAKPKPPASARRGVCLLFKIIV